MENGIPGGRVSRPLRWERTGGRRNLRMKCVVSLSDNPILSGELPSRRSSLVRKTGLPSASVKCQLLQLCSVKGFSVSPTRRVRMLFLM